jgi:uncharacterized DUF497 family protein
MEFEWHETKNLSNRAKHGFDFTFAVGIFAGVVREYVDPRPWSEQRIVATGQVEGRFILAAVRPTAGGDE